MARQTRGEEARAVQRMQDYIEGHIAEPITLLTLAREAGYSPFHAARLFRAWTEKTPFAYIRDMRLTMAALRLRDGDERIVDVALDFVFDSHEGFTKAFSRSFGVTPREYRGGRADVKLFRPYSALGWYQLTGRQEENVMSEQMPRSIFVQVIERPQRKLLLKRGREATEYFAYCEEVGCDVWDELCDIKEALYEPVGLWMPKSLRPEGTSEYVQGVELPVGYDGQVPDGYDLIDLAPCLMMVFQGASFPDEEFGTAIGELWGAIERYDPKLYGYEWADEAAPRFQLEPQGYRGYIEARPVKVTGGRTV